MPSSGTILETDDAAEDSWSVLPAMVGEASREPDRLERMKGLLDEIRTTGLRFMKRR